MNSPFDIERLRNKLAIQHKFKAFRKTYTKNYPEIININKKSFWDKKITGDRDMLKKYPMFNDKIRIVSKYLSTQRGQLLDIGFGWASLEEKIQKFDDLQIFGFDISSEAVKYAKEHLRGEYKVGNIYDIHYLDSKFDFITALDVLEHIAPSNIFGIYKSINKILKKGGKFIVTVPVNEKLEEKVAKGDNPIGHMRVYTPNIIETELKLNGYKILYEEFLYAFDKFYTFKKLFVKIWPFRIREPNLVIIIAQKK